MAVRGGAVPSLALRCRVRVVDDRVIVRLRIVARPGQALGPLTAQVRTAVAATSSACSASTSGR